MRKVLLTCLLVAASLALSAQKPNGKPISTDLFGIFFEDLNYAADGGLYAEMVQNRSFEYALNDMDAKVNKNHQWHPFTAWDFLRENGIMRISLETAQPLNDNNRHYVACQVLTPGSTGTGIRNRGYDGMVVHSDENYDFSAFFRLAECQNMRVKVRLTSDNATLAETTLTVSGNAWQQYTATLTPTASADNAALDLLFLDQGVICADMLSLFPQNTFKNRKNGLRKDIAETIAALHPRFMRFPGGCLTHGDGIHNIYNWKNTIGPVEQRKSDYNIWSYGQTMGLGYFEYLQFCEDIGAKPLPVLAAGVSCQNSARTRGTGQEAIPMDQMNAYIQDILDLIEYCNGPATSTWGAKRAQAGHPAPFNLEYIGIGNEDHITPAFQERFAMICNAIKTKYPDIKIVGTAGPDPAGTDFEKGWQAAKDDKVALVDEHYYRAPEWFLQNLHRYDNYDRHAPHVYIGEYASRGNTLWNAICEAAYLTQVERNGDVVTLTSYAPLLCREGVAQWFWRPDLIYFTKSDVFPTINYYVQQLFATNAGGTYYEGIVADLETASCVKDSKTGDIILKLVNTEETAKTIHADITTLLRKKVYKAEITTLQGQPKDENGRSAHNATDIHPATHATTLASRFEYSLPPYSLTVIRIHK